MVISFLCAAVALLLLPLSTNAFWILSHSILTKDRLDPIIDPGDVSMHVHTIIGASNFGPTVSNTSFQTANCTTSPVQADMSNYWAPQLYHRNLQNNTYTLIPVVNVNTYYLQRGGTNNTDIAAFPPGLRMVAGNVYRTTFNKSSNADLAITYVCLGTNVPQSNEFPTTNCKDGLRAQITFPSCWNNKTIDSEDHQSHMAYPIQAPDNGDCPSTHPVKVITLFHEWIFNVGIFDYIPGQKNWVFSFGDDVGYGFHADFINGWNQTVLEGAIKDCTASLFGNVEGCSHFVPTINRPLASSCTIPSVVDEPIVGPLSSLPGCNPTPVTKNATCPGLVTPKIVSGGVNSSAINDTSSSGKSSSTPVTNSTGSASSTTNSANSATNPASISTTSASSAKPSKRHLSPSDRKLKRTYGLF